MLILDLNSEQSPLWQETDSYFGKPFVWNLLHNYGRVNCTAESFDLIPTHEAVPLRLIGCCVVSSAACCCSCVCVGGTRGMYGDLTTISQSTLTLQLPGITMVGVGLTPEVCTIPPSASGLLGTVTGSFSLLLFRLLSWRLL